MSAGNDNTTPLTTNVREAYLCNDSLLLLKQEGKSHLSLTEISLADSKLRDRRYLVGIGQPAATALSWQLLMPDGQSHIFAAPDEDAKKTWMTAFTNALLDSLPFDLRFSRGYVHTILQGTQWSAAVLGDEPVLRGLAALMGDACTLDELDADGNAALHYAACHGHEDCARALLEAGARIDVPDTSDFNTPLHIACCQGHLQVAGLLAANLAPLNATNMGGCTPLMAVLQAQEIGKVVFAPRTVDWLIAQGADANIADAEGVLPIHRGVDLQHPQLIGLLVRGGASANSPRPLPDESGSLRPLHIACGASPLLLAGTVDVDTIVALLAHGAQPNSLSGVPHATPLHALLRRILHQNEAPTADKAIAIAVSSSAAARMCAYGARLDLADASGVAIFKLADEVGCRAALESACKNFAARVAPANAADLVQRLNKVSVLPFIITAGEVSRKGRLGHAAAPWSTDGSSLHCMLCAADFTVFSRRHHCRHCGVLVCQACSAKRFPLLPQAEGDSDLGLPRKSPPGHAAPVACATEQRVCDGCFNKLATLSDMVAAQMRRWEAEKAQALITARNFAPEVDASAKTTRAALMKGASVPLAAATPAAGPTGAVASQVGSVKSTMDETRDRLALRGEKLSQAQERTAQLADSARSFADLAAKLKEQNKPSWFGF